MVNRERWQKIEAVLDQALDVPEKEIPALLDELCEEDEELRREVEALLAAEKKADGVLEGSASEVAADFLPENAVVAQDEAAPANLNLGPYRLVRLIGRGGMGEVHEAWDERLQRTVAVKLLPPFVIGDKVSKDRFVREARAASALEHANICAVHDIGETEDGQPYIVMGYYPGETLREKLQRGPLSLDEARRIAVQVGRGLERAHAAGIVHRDIKPANVMLTEHGEAKILDFGIAKKVDATALTAAGSSLGTPSYMSPEQARGREVDARTDVYALGALLYQMLSGRRPFDGRDIQAILYAVLHEEPEALSTLRRETPRQLVRIIEKAMAKDIGKRYRDMGEMLRALVDEAPASSGLSTSTFFVGPKPTPQRWLAFGLIVCALVALTWYFFGGYFAGGYFAGGYFVGGRGESAPAVANAEQPSAAQDQDQEIPRERHALAVLPFVNTTGNTDLDWLRDGIGEMLTVELSESPELRVLSRRRLREIVAPGTAPVDAVRRVAESDEEIGIVLLGSYVRLGETLRISFSLENVAGDVLAASSVQGTGEESLFNLVDQLSGTVRRHFKIPVGAEPVNVEMITTSSIAAWRLYTEGVKLFRESKFEEASLLLEKAVDLDPEFTLALNNLAHMHRNLGNPERVEEYSRRAFENVDQLPAMQRFLVAGNYYRDRWSRYPEAINIYRQGLEYPDNTAVRRRLGDLYSYLERYEEALVQYESLRRDGKLPASAYFKAANSHLALGDGAAGGRLLDDLAVASPDNWLYQLFLAVYRTSEGRLGEAETVLNRAFELRPGNSYLHHNAWRLAVLREDWTAATAALAGMRAQTDEFTTWRATISAAHVLVLQGREAAALERYAEAAQVFATPGPYTALAHCWSAELLLADGRAEAARVEAEAAIQVGEGYWPGLRGLFLAALAAAESGDAGAADRWEEGLRESWRKAPNSVEERQLLRLTARRAALAGDAATALADLRRAAELLPANAAEIHDYVSPDHPAVWYELAVAEKAAGENAKARGRLEKALASIARIEAPLFWVQSRELLESLDGV